MIKLVAFDLDGTIGDTIPMCLKALKKAVTPYVTLNDVSENDILETFGLNEKGNAFVPTNLSCMRGKGWRLTV